MYGDVAIMSQRNEIERKAKEYVKLRGKGNVQMVLEFLDVNDLHNLDERRVNDVIDKLDNMIEKASD